MQRKEAWRITERGLDAARLGAFESVLAVGNGYLGVRGAPEEGAPAHDAGVILNGFHATWPIVYPRERLRTRPRRADDRRAARRLDHPARRQRRAGRHR